MRYRPNRWILRGSVLLFVLFSLSGNAQSCLKPFAQYPSTISTQSASLNWISTEDLWEIELSPPNDSSQYAITDHRPFFWNALEPGTKYQFRVRSICGNEVSEWSNKVSFSTHLSNPAACGLDIPIPNESCDFSNIFFIDVQNAPGQELGVDVRLKEIKLIIDHTHNNDLVISLTAPNGTEIILSDENGLELDDYGDPSDSLCLATTTFTDNLCFPKITDGNPPYIGYYRPEEPLELINETGGNPNASWKLTICDDHISNFGTLEFAELVFTPVDCPVITNPTQSQLGGDYVHIDWDILEGVDEVLIEYADSLFIPGSGAAASGGQIISVAGSLQSALIPNLNPSTGYYAFLRTRCGNSFGDNICFYFETDCANAAFATDFDDQAICTTKCGEPCPIDGIWTNSTSDDNDWVVSKKKTKSINTGPDADVNGDGHFIYTETSTPCALDAAAVLISNCLFVPNGVAPNCGFSFYYHMHGNGIGSLSLLAKDANQSLWDTLWHQEGAQGQDWEKAFIDLTAYSNSQIQLQFVGVRGGSSGDIGLDELTFYGAIQDLGRPNKYYADVDGDGYGDRHNVRYFCDASPPLGYTSDSTDCHDQYDFIFPGADEILCNQLDDNCNGMADDSALPNPSINPILAFCEGATATVNIADPAIGTYYWFSNGQVIGQGQNIVILNPTDGMEISVVDSMTIDQYVCKSDHQSAQIELNPIPVIGPDTLISQCSGIPFDLGDLSIMDANNQEINIQYHSGFPCVNANLLTESTINPNLINPAYVKAVTGNGCESVLRIDFNVLPVPSVEILPRQDTFELCPGDITVLSAGVISGTMPFTYSWSNGFETAIALAQTASLPNTYSKVILELTDQTGCSDMDTVFVGNNTGVTSVDFLDISDVTVCGGSDGHATIIPHGGIPPYTISWIGPVTGSIDQVDSLYLTGLTQGAYSIEISDSSPGQCKTTVSGLVINAPNFEVDIDTIIGVSCYGDSDGDIELVVSGSNPSYLWNDGATTEDREQLPPGLYSVTISDANCSFVLENIEISEPDILQTFVADVDHVSCYGDSTGSAKINVFGGSIPYTFQWSGDGQFLGSVASQLPAGTYSCSVVDANGCSSPTAFFDIAQPDALQSTIVTSDITCFGDQDGKIITQVSGGVVPYSWGWSDSLLQGSIVDDLAVGGYGLTVSDDNQCTLEHVVFINEPGAIVIDSVDILPPTCVGLSDGFIEVFGSGGSGVLQYYWDGFPEGAAIQNLSEGSYPLVIQDSYGCRHDSIVFDLSAYQRIQYVVDSIENIRCFGQEDGLIRVNPSGGHWPYAYFWSNGEVTQEISGLPAGNYQLTITDNLGCQREIDSLLISQPDPLSVHFSIEDIHCFGEASGSIFPTVFGGTGPFSYSWSSGDTLPDLVEVMEGQYQLDLTDSNGCTTSQTGEINEPAELTVEPAQIRHKAFCGQQVLGAIDVQVEGGTEPYAYQWNMGAISQDIVNLDTGSYSLVVTDFNGCSADLKPIRIFQTNEDFLITPTEVNDISCFGQNDGMIYVETQGGSLPYNYNWSNGTSTGQTWVNNPYFLLDNLDKGTYVLTITDSNGCVKVSDSIDIDEPTALGVFIDSVRHNKCFNDLSAGIYVTAHGGALPYHYLWTNQSFDEDLLDIPSGNYALILTDARDCIASFPQPVTIDSEIDSFVIQVDSVIAQDCNIMGGIEISVVGDVISPSFQWSNEAAEEDIYGLWPGYYQLTVSDFYDCTVVSDSIYVPIGQNVVDLDLDFIQHVRCYGEQNGSISIQPTGGAQPYAFYWSNNTTGSNTISNLEAGLYNVTVADANSCIGLLEDMEVFQPDSLAANITIQAAIGNNADGMITLDVEGGTQPYQYNWDDNTGAQTTNPATQLASGSFSVTVTDDNDCVLIIDSINVDKVTSISNLTASKSTIYPNPTSGIFTLKMPQVSGQIDLELVSVYGAGFPLSVDKSLSENTFYVKTSDIPPGFYLLKIKKNGNVFGVNKILIVQY